MNMKLLLWPRNGGYQESTLHYRKPEAAPLDTDSHRSITGAPPLRHLLLVVSFPIVKWTNLWRKHVAIPVGSYCTSVYFDGHHSQSLIRMCPPAPGSRLHTDLWYLIVTEVSVASLKSKSCKRLTAPQKLSQQTHDLSLLQLREDR